MSNQQIFPQSTYPISGDVQSTPGSPAVVVQGIQTAPVINQYPLNGQILIFDGPTNRYIPGDPIVSGTDPVGTPPSRPPVQIGGVDDGNLVREFRTDTNGAVELSMTDRTLLENILLEIRAMKQAIIDQDNTARDSDYAPDNFIDLKVGN
jgi:hypothetical protein